MIDHVGNKRPIYYLGENLLLTLLLQWLWWRLRFQRLYGASTEGRRGLIVVSSEFVYSKYMALFFYFICRHACSVCTELIEM